MSLERKLRRKAARKAKKAKQEKPVGPDSRALRLLQAIGSDTDVTRPFDGAIPCPHCGVGLETTHSIDNKPAEPGSFTVCIKCAGINRLTADGKLEAVSDAELEALPSDVRTTIRDLEVLIRQFRLRHMRGPRETPLA